MLKTPTKTNKPKSIAFNQLTPNSMRVSNLSVLPSVNLNQTKYDGKSSLPVVRNGKKSSKSVNMNDNFESKIISNNDKSPLKSNNLNSPLMATNKNSSLMNIFNKLNGISNNSTKISKFNKIDDEKLYENSPFVIRDLTNKTNKIKTKVDLDIDDQLNNFELNPKPVNTSRILNSISSNSIKKSIVSSDRKISESPSSNMREPLEIRTASSKKPNQKAKSLMTGNNYSDFISNVENNKENGIISSISYKTQAGKLNSYQTKTNQDSFLISTSILGIKSYNIFGVFDGHGSQGHLISDYVKTYFNSFFNQKDLYTNSEHPINEELVYNKLTESNYSLIYYSFKLCEESLSKTKLDPTMSGTTCVVTFCIGNKVICANSGDSRAFLSTGNGVKNLSYDHKPDNKEEKERILLCGGRVHPIKEHGKFVGPSRVWIKSGEYPGLAMSRSIGDFVAKSVGCTYKPGKIYLRIIIKKI